MLRTEPATDVLRQEHEHFVDKVDGLARAAEKIPAASAEERNRLVRDCLNFLNDELIPHAQAEEATLYPDWVELVGFNGAATFLIADHREIIALMDMLEETPSSEVDQLQQLLYGLEALIFSHFQKEEDLVFPSLDQEREDLTIQLLERFEAARNRGPRDNE